MIVVDVETTGTDPDAHALVSIGAVELAQPENKFYSECRAFAGAHFDEKALEINGFTKEELTDSSKKSLKVCLNEFLEWSREVADRTLAGHNVQFDIHFIEKSLTRVGEAYPFSHRTIDTHSLTYMHMIHRGLTPPFDEAHGHTGLDSDFVFDYVGLNITRGEHNALEDAKLTAEAISRLLYDEKLLEAFRQYSIPWKDE